MVAGGAGRATRKAPPGTPADYLQRHLTVSDGQREGERAPTRLIARHSWSGGRGHWRAGLDDLRRARAGRLRSISSQA